MSRTLVMENKGTISIVSSSARNVSSSGVRLGCSPFGNAISRSISRALYRPSQSDTPLSCLVVDFTLNLQELQTLHEILVDLFATRQLIWLPRGAKDPEIVCSVFQLRI